MSAVLLNIVIGLATSVLSGGSIWLLQRVRGTRILRGKAALCGLESGGTCLIVMNNHWRKPGTTAHDDVYTMIDVAALAYEAGCEVTVSPVEELHEGNGDRTEFCIGGPISNTRTAGHLAEHLPGVTHRTFTKRERADIIVGARRFTMEAGRREHALIAKFTPPQSSRPVILISGQTSTANRAAVHLLRRDYRKLSKAVGSTERFCIVAGVTSAAAFGHQSVEIVADVTEAAFARKALPGPVSG